ncbi:MAG: hypothetical protein RML45_14910 [Acetobacteraceae bacterium]|nr:hypothetical protein [Acetobacteraceae bacterium]
MQGSRASTSARVEILLFHTEVETTGASAFTLALLVSLFLLFADALFGGRHEPAIVLAAWLLAWFVLNLFGTAFFLTRALALLDPGGRTTATLAYAASVASPEEAAPTLAAELLKCRADEAGAKPFLQSPLPLTIEEHLGERRADSVSVTFTSPARLVDVQGAALVAVIRAIRSRCGAPALTSAWKGSRTSALAAVSKAF